jgi:4a-hydroxytetrahydrobiopterin dehydratase
VGFPLKDEDIDKALASLAYWQRDGQNIVREFKFDGFPDSINFVNRVADLAERSNHHPDITIKFNRVRLALSSHDSGGVTQRDIRLATAINQLKA